MVNEPLVTAILATLLPRLVPLPKVTLPVTVTLPLLILNAFVVLDAGLLIVTFPLTVNAIFPNVKDEDDEELCVNVK